MRGRGRIGLFGKILAAYIVTLFLIIFGFLLFRLLSETSPNERISVINLKDYAELLTDKIGTPPENEAIGEVLLNTNLNIRIEGPGNYAFLNGDEEFREEQGRLNPEKGWLAFLFFGKEGDFNVTVEREGYTFTYSDFHGDARIYPFGLGIFLLFFIAAVTVNYFLVRHLLNPLKKMALVAGRFGRNDWNARVNPAGRDELADLGNEIDAMADRIVGHIDGMRDLLYSVSHEFRSPLTRMKLLLEFLDDSFARSSLREEIDFLNGMTGALLEQKRLMDNPGDLNLTEFSLRDLAEEFSASYDRKGIELEGSRTGPDRRVFMDRTRILLAISNLVENSLKYAPGELVHWEIATEEDSPFCHIAVYDNGPGVPEDIYGRLGTPLPGRDAGKGFGMGLNIVKAVVEAHGGTVLMENRAPRGFRVTLKLPLMATRVN